MTSKLDPHVAPHVVFSGAGTTEAGRRISTLLRTVVAMIVVGCGGDPDAGSSSDAAPPSPGAYRLDGSIDVAISADGSTLIWSVSSAEEAVLWATQLATGTTTRFGDRATPERLDLRRRDGVVVSEHGALAAYVEARGATDESLVVARTDGSFVARLGPVADYLAHTLNRGRVDAVWIIDERMVVYVQDDGNVLTLRGHDVVSGVDEALVTLDRWRLGEEPLVSADGRRLLVPLARLVYDVDQRRVYTAPDLDDQQHMTFLSPDLVLAYGDSRASTWRVSSGEVLTVVASAASVRPSAGRLIVEYRDDSERPYRTELRDLVNGGVVQLCAPSAEPCEVSTTAGAAAIYEPGRGTSVMLLATGEVWLGSTERADLRVGPDGNWGVLDTRLGSDSLVRLASPLRSSSFRLELGDELTWWPRRDQLLVSSSLTHRILGYTPGEEARFDGSTMGKEVVLTPDQALAVTSSNVLPEVGVFTSERLTDAPPRRVFTPEGQAVSISRITNTHAVVLSSDQSLWVVPL